MARLMCLEDRVALEFDIGQIPSPDTSHDLHWIRQHAGPNATRYRVVAFITSRPRFHVHQPGTGGLITVRIRLDMPHMYIAREMTGNAAAMTAIRDHEAGHVPEWERVMTGSLQFIATDISMRISPPASVTARRVERIVRRFRPQWELFCNQAADTWDRTDYPRLHRVLQRAGVQVP